jgi:hypothetical protein
VEQSIKQINAYIQYTRLASPLGEILSINTDWVQLIAGIARPVFEDTKKLHHMEGDWFISIREFLHSTECQIKTKPGWLPQIEREHDKCITDIVSNETKDNAIKINRFRIYLQATTIADITNPKEPTSTTLQGEKAQPRHQVETRDNQNTTGQDNHAQDQKPGTHGVAR